MPNHPSDSEAQRSTEPELLRAVSSKLGIRLEPQKFVFDDGVRVEIDGYCDSKSKPVACEAFARIGKMNSGQKRKLGNDILKLLLLERRLKKDIRKIIVVAGEDALTSLSNQSWQAAAVREFDIEVLHATLSAPTVLSIKAAQNRQVMRNSESDQDI